MTQKQLTKQLDEITDITESLVKLIEQYDDIIIPEDLERLEDCKEQLKELTKNNSSAYGKH
jgi:hypothetical protein|tara:strand:+ start:463 stop:645 length:183 start_codon:yes stop_codon:yes gene_type:complete